MNTITWGKARWTFAAGVGLLLACAVVAGVLIVRIQDSNRRVMHAFSIQVQLQDLESTLAAAGRARTLYDSDPDIIYATETETRLASAQSQLNVILAQSSEIPAHHDTYTQLASLTHQRMDIIRRALLDAEAGKRDATTQDIYTRQIVEVADEIKTALEDLESHERQFADQRRIVSERLFLAIVWVLGLAFAVALSLLYLNYRFLMSELAERRRAERSALDSQETLRLLSVRLIRAQDEQSRKFSRELHDGLGQYLSLAKMNLSRHMRTQPAQTDLIGEAIELLDRSIAETRTISYLLHPPLLDDMGFFFAARWYVEGFSERSGIQVSVDIPEQAERLPLPVEMAFFRVLQECLANIHRHSASQRADVSLVITPTDATLRVHDYGKGIPALILRQFHANGGRVGVGLAGMRERIREQGGYFDVQSTTAGTTVTVRMPVTVVAANPQNIPAQQVAG